MTFSRILLSILFSTIIIYADANDNNDTFEAADSNITTKSKDRDGYMPSIITPNYAKSGFYGGLALATGYIDADKLGSDTMLDLSLIAGYNINEYLATEGRATISIAYSNGIDYRDISLFLKPKYEAYDGLSIYSLIGFGNVNIESINSNDTKSSKTSLQYGLGADYKLKNNFKLFADYTFLGKDSNAKYKNFNTDLSSGSFTTGISYDF